MISILLLYANAILSAAICLRLIFYRRGPARHHAGVSWLAWLLVVCSGSVAIRTAFGVYAPVDWAEFGISAALAIAVFHSRGNLARLFWARSGHAPVFFGRREWKN